MQKPIRHVSALVVALLCVAVHGQAPPADRAAAGPCAWIRYLRVLDGCHA